MLTRTQISLTRITLMAILVAIAAGGIVIHPGSRSARAEVAARAGHKSLPGQFVVVTINGKQRRTLDVERFDRLLELALALRDRVPALNGGPPGTRTSADVIVINEMTQANAEIFKRLLNQRSVFHYELVGPEDSKARFLYNTGTLAVSQVSSWADACLDGIPPEEERRVYQKVTFLEEASGTIFTVAGVHIKPKYPDGVQCTQRNIDGLRLQTELDPGPVILAGDFNRRAMKQKYECDPDERSDPADWWLSLTQPALGQRAYVDAVRETHRRSGRSLENKWTHEQKARKETCRGTMTIRRSRIDYLFADQFSVAQADVDHPGWTGGAPGAFSTKNGRYSDHRFVWARFAPGSIPRLPRPDGERGAGGAIALTWKAHEQASRYVVYRGRGRRSLTKLAVVDDASGPFVDTSTKHGRTYRYAVAAIASTGAYGWESRPISVRADAVGPRVIDVDPEPGKTRVRRRAAVAVRFDEKVAPGSVHNGSISVYRGRHKVAGILRQPSARILRFQSTRPLKRQTRFRVVVRPVLDQLGNKGSRYDWVFSTGKR